MALTARTIMTDLFARLATVPTDFQCDMIFGISMATETLAAADELVRDGDVLEISLRAHALVLAGAQKFLGTLARNPGLAGPLTDALVDSLAMQVFMRAQDTATQVLDVLPAGGEA